MDWVITYYDVGLKQKIMQLPKEILARYLVYTDLLMEFGPDLVIPNIISIDKDLYAMTVRDKIEGVTFYFCQSAKDQLSMLYLVTAQDSALTHSEHLELVRHRQGSPY